MVKAHPNQVSVRESMSFHEFSMFMSVCTGESRRTPKKMDSKRSKWLGLSWKSGIRKYQEPTNAKSLDTHRPKEKKKAFCLQPREAPSGSKSWDPSLAPLEIWRGLQVGYSLNFGYWRSMMRSISDSFHWSAWKMSKMTGIPGHKGHKDFLLGLPPFHMWEPQSTQPTWLRRSNWPVYQGWTLQDSNLPLHLRSVRLHILWLLISQSQESVPMLSDSTHDYSSWLSKSISMDSMALYLQVLAQLVWQMVPEGTARESHDLHLHHFPWWKKERKQIDFKKILDLLFWIATASLFLWSFLWSAIQRYAGISIKTVSQRTTCSLLVAHELEPSKRWHRVHLAALGHFSKAND